MPVFDQEKVDRLKQILKWHPRGITISDLSAKMEMNRNLVAKYLDILLISGQVEMQVIGAAKVYFLSHRVPISSMLEFSSDMVIILDSALTIMQVNEPVLGVVKEKKETFVGRNIREIDHPFLKAIPISVFSKETDPAQGQVQQFECTIEGEKDYYKLKRLQTVFEDGSHGTTLIIEDITAQVTYQKMLELNEAKYRGIVEDQTEFITRFLPDGTLVFVNDAYARYLGKEKEELLGGLYIPDIVSDDRTTAHQCIQSLDMNNPVQTFECRIHHSCGQVRWNLWTVRALFDTNQNPLEYQGIGKDNTEKREAATRINQYIRDMEFLARKAQEFVELSPDVDIFQVIGQGISEIIPDALITVNSIDEQSDTLTVRAVLPERDREPLKKYIGKDLLGFRFNISVMPEHHQMHFFSTQQAGKLVHIEENLHTIFFQQISQDSCDMIKKGLNLGESLYTIGLTRHGILFGNVSFSPRKGETVTSSSIIETFVRQASIVLHRRRTDDALKSSEARYRGIVEDQTEFVTRFLPDGTLTYLNDAVCRYFEKDRAELLGQSVFSLSQIPEDDQQKLGLDLHSLDTQNPVQSVEHRVLDPSGHIRWTQWTNRALSDDNGTLVEIQGVGRDITEQKEAEAKIRQYIADIEYLSQKSYEFLELPADMDIYETICRGVKGILPTAVVVINSDDPVTNVATTRCVLGDEERDVFSTLIGKDVIGMKVKLPEPDELQKERMAVMSRKLTKVPGNLFITMHNQVPEDICAKIETALNIGDVYAIGLVSQGIIWASVVIMLRKGEIITHKDLIEAYMAHASIALLRYRTEKSLKKSEKLYRSVIENIQDVFYRSDKQGTLIMASPSWARMLGYDSLDDCIGYNIAEKFYFEPQLRKEFLDAVYRKGSVSDYEVTLKCRDGSPLYVSTNSHLYYDEGGTLVGVEGIFRDISERHAATERIEHYITTLRESEEIFSSVAQQSPFPIAIIEPDGTYRYVNQKFVETFGYDLNDFKTGREWFSLAYPDPHNRKKVIDTWKSDLEASESGIERPEIFTVRCKNGVDREIVFHPVTLSDNKQCVVYEDLTDQHKAEQVKKLLSLIVDTTSDAITGEKTDGTIISMNPAAEHLYGYSKEEIIGQNTSLIIPQDRRDESKRIFDRIIQREAINNCETCRVRKDGKVIDVELTISPITDEKGMVIGASTVARDISLKKSEERLRESEEKYRTHVENMNAGIYRSTGDPRGRFVWGNSSLVEILGYPSFETLRQIAVADIFCEPEGRKELLDDLQRFGFVKNREIHLIRDDGTRIWVSITALAKFDPAGKIEFINGIVEDVTRKKEITPQLQKFRYELVDLVGCLPDPAFAVSETHQVIAWNAAMEQMTGISKDEIIGSEGFLPAFPKNTPSPAVMVDLINLIDAADEEIEKYDPPLTREGNSLVTQGYFPSLYSGRGSYIWAKASPLIDHDGRRMGAIEVIRDVSALKELHQLLKNPKTGCIFGSDTEISLPDAAYPVFPDHDSIKTPGLLSPNYLSSALKMARDYIAILDRSGKCVWVNEALAGAVNAGSCNDLAGKSIALYIAPEFRKMALDSLSEVKKNGHKTVPFMMLSSSGRVQVEANISAITTEEGDLFGYMAIARHVEGKKSKNHNDDKT